MSVPSPRPGPVVGYADTQDMFRVSPWITYDPSPDARSEPLVRSNIHFYNMNDDVEMDAPQISTLREEETPEPQPTPARTSKFRVKLLVNEGKRSGSLASSASQKQTHAESDDEDEDEDEEDQLIDDDDEDLKPTAVIPPLTTVSSRGSPAKRGQGRGRGGKRKSSGRAGAQDLGPNMTWFEVNSADSIPAATGLQGEVWDAPMAGSSAPAPPPLAKKRAAPAKGVTAQRAIRKKPSKYTCQFALSRFVTNFIFRTVKAVVIPHRDDAESISEAYVGTAASSPLPQDERTPEPDVVMAPTVSAMTEDDALEGVPLPVYPLPSKPFPVQPPPKIGTGFAPVIPLDKSGKQVRRWRQVNREIRGIAGGRWFARTWVGEKGSEFASAAAAASQALIQAAQTAAERESASAAASTAAGVTLPKSLTSSISGSTSGKQSAKSKAAKTDAGTATVPPSRSASIVPESVSTQMSKKRSSAQGTPSTEVTVNPPAP
ncbi:hypothetical protein AcW1_001189 [Taiwanofungus camphoratus]|nr:hypothetical protein AcW1_001189 [Antrodia cinnamomea]